MSYDLPGWLGRTVRVGRTRETASGVGRIRGPAAQEETANGVGRIDAS